MFKQVALVALFAVMTYGFNVESEIDSNFGPNFGPGSHVSRRNDNSSSSNNSNNSTNNNETETETETKTETETETETETKKEKETETETETETKKDTFGNTDESGGNADESGNGTTTTNAGTPKANEETVQTLTVKVSAEFGAAFEALATAAEKVSARTATATTITSKMDGLTTNDVDATYIKKNGVNVARRNRATVVTVETVVYTVELVFKSGVSAAKVTTGLTSLKLETALEFTINGVTFKLDMSKASQGTKIVSKRASATSSVASALLFISAVAVAALL